MGRDVLESKDREQLVTIAQAIGIKSVSRLKKGELVDKILEQTSMPAPAVQAAPAAAPAATPAPAPAARAATPKAAPKPSAPEAADAAPEVILGPDGEPLADWEVDLIRKGEAPAPSAAGADDDGDDDGEGEGGSGPSSEDGGSSRKRRRRNRNRNRNRGEDGDEAGSNGGEQGAGGGGGGERSERGNRGDRNDRGDRGGGGGHQPRDFGQPRSRNDRRDRDRYQPRHEDLNDRGDDTPVSTEPVRVQGYLDLHDQGYGFLRINGYLSSRDDAYVSVKQTRQYGLRKGDHVVGMSRPASRNEKNPALLEIFSINGKDPDQLKGRLRFEDLTPLFPDSKLHLENPNDPSNMTARIIDLVSPIGKGQRGIIVSPPKAGKTTVMKTIANSIEKNNPEVTLIVLLIDERPEEVTDFRRTISGEVIASTFDRPSDEHTHLAELVIEKAKRLVEMGKDVVIILDGITRLSRAYNLAAPATGRIMSGGIDAGALYPPKKFFGAARNVEEGGSLTVLATALVETNSRMDEAIFEEFKGTGNMELRLDRKLAERRIYPAIDVDASSTRHEELLFDRKQLQMVWKLRRVLSGLAADGNAAPGLELLIDRLKTFRTNDQFLEEISKQPSM